MEDDGMKFVWLCLMLVGLYFFVGWLKHDNNDIYTYKRMAVYEYRDYTMIPKECLYLHPLDCVKYMEEHKVQK